MHTHATEPESLPIDPVCGMEVDPSTDLRTDYNGTTYFFCHPSCLERFTANPIESNEQFGSVLVSDEDTARAAAALARDAVA